MQVQLAVFAAWALLCAPLHAGEVAVSQAWVRATVPGQKATGAFMQITAADAFALVGAASPVAGVTEVHEMAMVNNVMKMRSVERLELPAGKAVELKPGGYHVMLMDLKQQLKPGDTVAVTLRLEGPGKVAKTLEVKAEVRDLTSGPMPRH